MFLGPGSAAYHHEMNFDPTESHRAMDEMDEGVRRICIGFGNGYWTTRKAEGRFPIAFHRATAEGGWLGITVPEELGNAEAAIMMHAVTSSGGGYSAAPAIHINLFGPMPRTGADGHQAHLVSGFQVGPAFGAWDLRGSSRWSG